MKKIKEKSDGKENTFFYVVWYGGMKVNINTIKMTNSPILNVLVCFEIEDKWVIIY